MSEQLCECGCGHPTRIAETTSSRDGWVRGEPLRFINGHNRRQPVISRFVAGYRIDEVTGCWVWQRPHPNGYPAHLEPVTHRENMLRSHTLVATRSRLTHCKRDHPFEAPHLRVMPNGSRRCRTCESDMQRKRRRKALT